jgi:hypothetical protein
MRNVERNKVAEIFIYSFFIFWLISVPFARAGAAEPKAGIKPILLKMISSVTGSNISRLQKDDSGSKTLPVENADSIAAPLSSSPVKLYFPLNNNDVKHYEGTIAGSTYLATYRYAQVLFNGSTCYRETDSADGSIVYYGYSGSDVHMLGLSLEGESFPFDTPLKILNDSILTNGGSLRSNTSFTIDGTAVTLDMTVISSLSGTVATSLGAAHDCRSIRMTFLFGIPGESETLELEDVWILAPEIGKLRIAVLNEFLVQLGWLTISGGTVGGVNVAEILKPTVSGYARTSNGSGISGVEILFSNGGGRATTNSSGYYSHPVDFERSGTATPSLRRYTFIPKSRDFSNVTSDRSDQNFTGAIKGQASFPFLNLLFTDEE